MRILIFIAMAASIVMFGSAASAQIADKRSFLHPLGFWSNDGFVAQRRVYPRFHYASPRPDMEWPGHGGWVLYERNW
jgi:hypothetical protein